MRAHSAAAFFASLALHGAAVAAVVLLTFLATRDETKPPVIFELVAGPPTAPDELVAPALGNSLAPVKMTVPKETPPPETVKTTPTPPADAAPEVIPAKPTPAKPTANAMTKELKKSERMSYRDYLKKHPAPKVATAAPPRAGAVPKIDAEGIAEGVKGGSMANKKDGGGGKAMSREEQDELSRYISFLLQELKAAHEPPPGVSDQLETKVTFDIAADGTITNPRVAKSSGNREFDASVIAAFRNVRPIGPTPNNKGDTWTVTFRMREAE